MYRYVAFNSQRKIIEGTIESSSEKSAEDSLYKAGFETVISISKVRPTLDLRSIAGYFSNIKEEELIEFTSELATLIDSGFVLLTALRLLQTQTRSKLLKEIIGQIINDLQNGKQLHEALSAHPKVFSSSYLGIMQASERSGTLSDGLKQIAADMQRQAASKSKVRRALIQPGIVLFVAIVAIVILTRVVFPPLVNIFDSFGANLPFGAKVMVGFTNFSTNYGVQTGLGILVAIFILILVFRLQSTKVFMDQFLLGVPLIGTTILWNITARMSRTLGILVRAGIILPEAIIMTIATIKNSHIQKILRQIRADIIQGRLLSESIKRSAVFPQVLTEMVTIGETSGQLEQAFLTMADYYDNKLEGRLVKMTTFLEPALILGLGLLVGFLAVSVISTMYTLPGAIGL